MSAAKTSPHLHPLPSPSLGPSWSRTSFPWKQIRLVSPSLTAANVPDLLDYDCPYQWLRGRFQPQLKLLGSNETESEWLANATDSHATQRGYPDCFAGAFGRGRDEGTTLVLVVHLQKFRTRYVKLNCITKKYQMNFWTLLYFAQASNGKMVVLIVKCFCLFLTS